jgi:hypothetical protein
MLQLRSVVLRSALVRSALVCAALVTLLACPAAHAASGGTAQAGVWQHHQADTPYYGITAIYTCSGIEDAVKRLLLSFGARSDVSVRASCPDPTRPVRTAMVHSSFYSLEPADSTGGESVPARWIRIELMPQVVGGGTMMRSERDGSEQLLMDRGECELVRDLKAVLTKSFSLRDVQYRADCFPNSASLQDFSVTAQVMKAVNGPKAE